MSRLERFSSFVGVLLLGLAAYIVTRDRKKVAQQSGQSQQAAAPVEQLGEKLKEAWASHHNR